MKLIPRTLCLFCWAQLLSAFLSIPAFALPLELRLETLATGLDEPTGLAHAGDDRLFIVGKRGRVFIYANGQLRSQPFIDLSDRVLYDPKPQSEQGLLSIAFHPRYAQNGFFYATYINRDGNAVIARYQVSSSNPNFASRGSERVLMVIDEPGPSHNVNHLQFGPDAYLYVTAGDGGYLREPRCSGQETDHLLGKVLRLDVDQNLDQAPYYGIPPSNPFAGSDGVPDEIWALGLRNPWRLTFDRVTGDLYLADVGQNDREEVNFERSGSPGGANYGFKMMEGTVCRGISTNCPATVPPCNSAAYTRPIFDYTHEGGRCAVIGGYVYRGSEVPELYGKYVFGDFCGPVGLAEVDAGGDWSFVFLTTSLPDLVTFGEDSGGELYLIAEQSLLRVVGVGEPSSVAFGQSDFEVQEGAGEAVVTVERGGPLAAAISVDFTTRAESASPGLDYAATSGSLSWAAGDGAAKTLRIPIFQDDELEGTETLVVELENDSSLVVLGQLASARVRILDDDLTPGPCEADGDTLCLNDERFRVEARWRTPDGQSGVGQARGLTDETGTFWFFNANNVEVVIKVLAGCFDPFNHYWVFAAGLTNVEVTLTVVDTAKGLLRRYHNPLDQPFQPILDTRAFATCP